MRLFGPPRMYRETSESVQSRVWSSRGTGIPGSREPDDESRRVRRVDYDFTSQLARRDDPPI